MCCAVRDVVAVDIVMGLRSRMSQYGNYVSNWVLVDTLQLHEVTVEYLSSIILAFNQII